MDDVLTVADLEARWENVLTVTNTVVTKYPGVYRELKSLTGYIVDNPLDIKEYLPTAEKIVNLLKTLDPNGRGSIFNFFHDRISPSSIWQVSQLRLECQDLLDHLKVFDAWRLKNCKLKIVK